MVTIETDERTKTILVGMADELGVPTSKIVERLVNAIHISAKTVSALEKQIDRMVGEAIGISRELEKINNELVSV